VHSITGENIGDNVGPGSPYIHLHPTREPGLRIRLMMKGGGCENVGAQYSLPDARIGAGRDLDGVRRSIIDAVHQAQGYGCAPGTVGVGVGGDRVTSYIESKEQLFRPLDDANGDSRLDALEKELTESLNGLKIGPMGWGGKTTILGVKIGHRERLPASFFVSISYMCWAYRKGGLRPHRRRVADRRRAPGPRHRTGPLRFPCAWPDQTPHAPPARLPVPEARIRELRVGDEVEFSGALVTGRDAAHKYLVKAPHDATFERMARGTLLYHCGPVVKRDAEGRWTFVAAGPTTSIREEPYQADVIARYGIRGVIGKGGMGPKTLAAFQQHGAVYLHAIGGLAVVLAHCVTRVREVYKLEELGVPEAMWHIEVKDFPSVVTMDSHGGSLTYRDGGCQRRGGPCADGAEPPPQVSRKGTGAAAFSRATRRRTATPAPSPQRSTGKGERRPRLGHVAVDVPQPDGAEDRTLHGRGDQPDPAVADEELGAQGGERREGEAHQLAIDVAAEGGPGNDLLPDVAALLVADRPRSAPRGMVFSSRSAP
jgi:fumarate hydratase class I